MNGTGTLIEEQGRIRKLVLSGSWSERLEAGKDLGPADLRELSPVEEKEVRLCFYYRGYPVSPVSASAFKKILGSPAHILVKSEIAGIEEILADAASPDVFSILSMRTMELGGKMVLVVDGRWTRQRWDTHSIYIAADADARVVQQVYLLAPPERFPVYLSRLKSDLKEIAWIID